MKKIMNNDIMKKLMTKKAIGIIGAIIVIIVGFNIVSKPSIKRSVDALPIIFTGYNGSGTMTVKDNSKAEKASYSLLKSIALVDAKKSGIDMSKVKEIIKNNPTDSNELKTRLIDVDSFSVSLNEAPKYQNFIDHLNKTSMDTGSDDLKNGDKVKFTVADSSTVPYFKAITKTYTVKGLKKTKVVSLSDKDFKIKTTGTNDYGDVDVTYNKKDIFESETADDGNRKQFANGDTITLTSKNIANKLNTQATKYTLAGDKVTLKISSFEDATMAISNLGDIIKRSNFDDDSDIADNAGLVAYISASSKSDLDSPTLDIFAKDKTGGYLNETYRDVTLKNGKLDINNHYPQFSTTNKDETPAKQMLSSSSDNKYVYKLVQK